MHNSLLSLEDVSVHFPHRSGFHTAPLKAVDRVSFSIERGEVLGLVGESGCGKSTLGRTILQLLEPTEGRILYEGKDFAEMTKVERKHYRSKMQMVFQDPFACLNPRMKVDQIIGEPLRFHGVKDSTARREMVAQTMKTVGLSQQMMSRYPHEFSGGQQQRIGIARALVQRPEFVVCDEPVSALDVSVQSQVLNLLEELRETYGLTYLFISHNLSVIHHLCDRVAIMYLGQVVELGTKDAVFNHPLHPYTKALISAILSPDVHTHGNRIVLQGDLPSPLHMPQGCSFHTRCYEKCPGCDSNAPQMVEVEPGHWVRCHRCN